MIEYDDILGAVVSSVDELEREVDTEVRKEFSECTDRLDEVLDILRSMDKSDFLRLTAQMIQLQAMLHMATACTCVEEARWHSCLSRIVTAVGNASERCKRTMVVALCELGDMPQEIADAILAEDNFVNSDELPELPTDTVIPDNIKELDNG